MFSIAIMIVSLMRPNLYNVFDTKYQEQKHKIPARKKWIYYDNKLRIPNTWCITKGSNFECIELKGKTKKKTSTNQTNRMCLIARKRMNKWMSFLFCSVSNADIEYDLCAWATTWKIRIVQMYTIPTQWWLKSM